MNNDSEKRRSELLSRKKEIELDLKRKALLKDVKFPLDNTPVTGMDIVNDYTSGIQSLAKPFLTTLRNASGGTPGYDYFQGILSDQEESAKRGASLRQWRAETGEIPNWMAPGKYNVGNILGEIGGAVAMTKGQGIASTWPGRAIQSTANSVALAPSFLPEGGNVLEAMDQGAKYGMLFGLGGEGVRKGVELGGPVLRKVFSEPATRASHMLKDVLGDKLSAIKESLRNVRSRVPGEKLTAGEAAVNAGSTKLSTLQKIVNKVDPDKYYAIDKANRAARIAELKKHGGNVSALEDARNVITGPLRTGALERADIGSNETRRLGSKLAQERQSQVNAMQDQGKFATTAAQQQNLATGGRGPSGNLSPSAYPVEGMPRIPPRYTENAQRVPEALSAADDAGAIAGARRGQALLTKYQLDSLAAHSHYPLKSESVIQAIDDKLADKVISTVERKALATVKENILSRTDADGIIGSNALYTARKEIGLNMRSIFEKSDIQWNKKMAAKTQSRIQKIIDKAIENAGGSGWKDYLRAFVHESKKVDNAVAGNKLAASLEGPYGKETPIKFAKEINKNPPINQSQAASRDAVMESVERKMAMKNMAAKGVEATRDAINMAAPRLPNTGMFSPTYQVMKSIINRFSDRATKEVMKELANNFDDPAKLLKLLNKSDIPGPWQETILALSNQAQVAAAIALARQSSGVHPH